MGIIVWCVLFAIVIFFAFLATRMAARNKEDGLHDTGLVHISQLANKYVRDPHEVVSVGDIVKVWVHEIDKNRRYPGAPFWRMAAHYGQMEMRAHLRWANETLAELNKIARKQRGHSTTRREKRQTPGRANAERCYRGDSDF